MTLTLKRRLTNADRVAVAALAHVDPRSVKSYVDGGRRQHPTTVDAIERALRKLGLVAPPARQPNAGTLDLFPTKKGPNENV